MTYLSPGHMTLATLSYIISTVSRRPYIKLTTEREEDGTLPFRMCMWLTIHKATDYGVQKTNRYIYYRSYHPSFTKNVWNHSNPAPSIKKTICLDPDSEGWGFSPSNKMYSYSSHFIRKALRPRPTGITGTTSNHYVKGVNSETRIKRVCTKVGIHVYFSSNRTIAWLPPGQSQTTHMNTTGVICILSQNCDHSCGRNWQDS